MEKKAEKWLEHLNAEQQAAVMNTEGYIRLIAGAGSGKTRTLTNRYVYLVEQLGISTSNILCVTFTNKAANEMKKRIRQMTGDNDTAYICTFHGFCVTLLREDIHLMRYPANFVILDTEDVDVILRQVYEDAGIDSRRYPFSVAKDMISGKKELGEHIKWLAELETGRLKKAYEQEKRQQEKIFLGFLYEQRKCVGLDFDDLITLALHLLKTSEETRLKWQEKLMYVMVDEFQDVSANQYELAGILSDYHHNLFVVGDPDQTIYSWRGADVKYIVNFDQVYPTAQTYFLNTNYRSTPEILAASDSLIEKNRNRIPKHLIPVRESGEVVSYFHAKTVKQEAEQVISQIKALTAADRKLSDIAILYRSHFVSRSIEEHLIKAQIPYVLYSGVEFYRRKEIKDVLAYLRLAAYGDDLSLMRVINTPRRGFGRKRVEWLRNLALREEKTLLQLLLENREDDILKGTTCTEFLEMVVRWRAEYAEKGLTDFLEQVLDESGYEKMLRTMGENERLENIAELKQSVYEYEKTAGEEVRLEDYLDRAALFTNTDKKEAKECVKLMTIHTAKGLEFPYVFVCGLNEGIFPNRHVDTRESLEEERRLAYVACTRAENALYLSDAEGVNFDGSFRYPSRFVFNIDKELITYKNELPKHLYEEATRYISREEAKLPGTQSEVQTGASVTHPVFGKGIITAVRDDIGCYEVQFEKFATPRNIKKNVLK